MVSAMGAGIHKGKLLCIGAVGVQFSGQYALILIFRRLNNGSTGAVAKNNGHISSAGTKVQPHGVHFCPYHQHIFVHPCFHKLISNTERINKPAALIANVEGAHFFLCNA